MKDKVVWITGATSGIGEELAYLYSKKEARVVISARREQELIRVKSNCSFPNNILCLPLDLEDSSNFSQLVETVISTFGGIDLLINNGGISQRSKVVDTPEEIDRRIMEINYFGNIALTKAVLPSMIAKKSGHIVPISSLTGKFGFFLRSAYSASKHALHGFYESLRLEEEANNIDITIVCPALIKTNISINALDSEGNKQNAMDENQEKGMDPKDCSQIIYDGIKSKKHEILVGNGEEKSILLKRLFPKLFYKVIKKQKHT